MPRPAQCCRPAQVDDKTVIAPDLSLRGGRRPTWQSRSTRPHRGKATGETATAFPRLPRRFAPRNDTSGEREVHQRPPTVELLPTGRSLSAATGPVWGGCHFNDSLCESFVQHREGHAPPLQWRVPRNGGWYGTAVPSRACTPRALSRASRSGRHVASLLAMTHQGGAAVHQCPPAVELLPTGRSLSAATDAIGRCVFIGTLYELEVPSRDCHVASLLAMTNLGAIAF